MIRDEASLDARGSAEKRGGEPSGDDILRRIAALIGEIDALRRERHAEPVFDARARLASSYFKKRQNARADA